jgi:hypothetical protein
MAAFIVALLALPLACGSVGRDLACGVGSRQPAAGLFVQLAEIPAVADGDGAWCTVSRGKSRLVMGVLGLNGAAALRTILYLPDVNGVDAVTLRWIHQNLVGRGFQVVVGCYSNAFGPESLACPDAPDLANAVLGARMLIDATTAIPSAQPLGILGVLQGGVVGVMAAAGRSDVRAVVDDGGSPGSLSLFGLGPAPTFTGPTAVRASVLVLGPDSPAYDRSFEGVLRSAGTSVQDVMFLPTSNGALTRDAGVGLRATREATGFLESELR